MKFSISSITILSILLSLPSLPANADEVRITTAQFSHQSNNRWTIDVTLKHQDSGWKHFADNWRVVDSDRTVLGNRILHHPHINEQPFTRSLTNIVIPPKTKTIYIEARDNVHGWSINRLKIDLSKARYGKLTVTAEALQPEE